ncbi:phosphoenolpyruvate--protein phosphotransferase [Defluviitalea phaphyphila]|uniref:phosphoenolpyruvate--protein phosphotransferase n=1 Tax=Defluviitalea phaphyphila TaxID=1473580 RepID=UPI000730D1A4|nr:phosphoenolpyruvate--protein phosphotransferase [Defluviitalea phaphyphila]
MTTLTGIPVSSGIAIGKALILKESKQEISKKTIENIDIEKMRFEKARKEGIRQIDAIYKKTLKSLGEEKAAVFHAHKMMIEDMELVKSVENYIEENNCNVEYALHEVTKNLILLFKQMDNEYMRERAADLQDIEGRLQKILSGNVEEDLSHIEEPVILIAEDLTPSQTAQMDTTKILGFITELGGKTSHAGIFAKTLGIPAIVGVNNNLLEKLSNNQKVAFDGSTGEIYIDPTKEQLQILGHKLDEHKEYIKKINQVKGKSAKTIDGFTIELAGNIGNPKEAKYVLDNEGCGIGLFRTEFLYMGKEGLPSEEEQFKAYKSVATLMKEKPVIIRTLDIGGDKQLDYLEMPKEMNPFLGFRAIRLCLKKEDIFKTQLRAILRASVYGNLKVMFPMICSMEELNKAKELLEKAKLELEKENIPFNSNIEIGMMIETPATAVLADLFIKEVDFFSIGTNDLVQYTLAVDRINEHVSNLYSPYNPAVLRLIKNTIEAAKNNNKWVGICGEAASDPLLIPVWLYFGVNELSMSPNLLMEAKWIIRSISNKQLDENIRNILLLNSGSEIKEALIKLNKEIL